MSNSQTMYERLMNVFRLIITEKFEAICLFTIARVVKQEPMKVVHAH